MAGQSFGLDLEAPRAWCNLCRAEGKTFELPADTDWFAQMGAHTRLAHREHVAALHRGEKYEPVEVAP